MDSSPPGSSVLGSLQARTLGWAAIPFSRGSSKPRMEPWCPAVQVDSLLTEAPGKPRSAPYGLVKNTDDPALIDSTLPQHSCGIAILDVFLWDRNPTFTPEAPSTWDPIKTTTWINGDPCERLPAVLWEHPIMEEGQANFSVSFPTSSARRELP